jgi:hypothetical protein
MRDKKEIKFPPDPLRQLLLHRRKRTQRCCSEIDIGNLVHMRDKVGERWALWPAPGLDDTLR